MELLNSPWLLHMIDSSAKKPADKLLSIYACLNSWVLAPGILETLAKSYSYTAPLVESCPALKAHLIDLATEAKIPNPAMYVSQMFILLQGAIAEELRYPGTGALLRAQDAAEAVMLSVKPKPMAHVRQNVLVGSSFASAVFLCVIAFGLNPYAPKENSALAVQVDPAPTVQVQPFMSPDLISEVIALKQEFDSGNCPAPQLLNIPPDKVEAYMDVVETRVSDNQASHSQRLRGFLDWYHHNMAWECYSKSENKQKIVLGMGQ